MLPVLLAETATAMAGYGMETRKGTKVGKCRGYGRECRHPSESMVWSLGHSTVTRSIEEGKAKKAHPSIGIRYQRRFSPISLRISVVEEWFSPESPKYSVPRRWISKTMR